MTNEQAKADFAVIMDGVQQQMRTIAEIQQRRSELIATATARGKKVSVTVNADNKVVDVKFGPDVEELSYAEIAKAVVDAAQRAGTEVAEKTARLMAPLQEQQAALPKLSDLLEGMEGLDVPGTVTAPTTRPGRGAQGFSDGSYVPGPEADDRSGRGGSVTDSSW